MKGKYAKKLLKVVIATVMVVTTLASVQTAYAEEINNKYKIKWNVTNNSSWNNTFNNNKPLTVEVVDTNGNLVKVANGTFDVTTKDGKNIDIEDLYQSVNGYKFVKAYLKNDFWGTTDVTSVSLKSRGRENNKTYYYQYNSGTTKYDAHTLYIQVQAVENIPTVKTASTKDKIKMSIINFDGGSGEDTSVIGGGYTENGVSGQVKQNLLKRVLDEDGIPRSTATRSKKLTKYFDTSGLEKGKDDGEYLDNLDHLFSYNEKSGNYEYSSFNNYAYLNDDGNFTVYDAVGTPAKATEDKQYFFKRGNFLPYDDIYDYNEIIKNGAQYNEDGIELNSSQYRDLYYMQNAQLHFAMQMETSFYQPKGGIVNDEEMVYKFNGDDDLWIYIDNVLVLDIGGIHDAKTGSINFKTGDVKVAGCQDTTIKEMYRKAGQFPDGTKWNESKVSQYFNGNTFKDFTGHKMKMFYIERGRGASNLHMKFNLPILPSDSVTLGKQLNENTDPIIFGNTKFGFQMFIKDENGRQVPITKDNFKEYNPIIKNSLNDEKGTPLTADDFKTTESGYKNVFYLKPYQYITFENLKVTTQYKFTEVDVTDDRFDVTIDGWDTVDENENDISSDWASVSDRPIIIFRNSCTAENRNLLYIYKDIDGTDFGYNDDFTMLVKFDGQNFIGEYDLYNEKGDHLERVSTTNGKVQLKAGQHIVIRNVMSDIKYEITEVDLPTIDGENVYSTSPKYQHTNKKGNSELQNGNSGTILFDEDAMVKVTNKYNVTSLKITKTIDELDKADGDPIFTFKITNQQTGEVLYRTIRFSDENTLTKETEVLKDLPVGKYTVEELDTIRYVIDDEKNKSQTKVVSGDTKVFDFNNKLAYDEEFSHTDVVENKFTIGDDGTVSVTKDYLGKANQE